MSLSPNGMEELFSQAEKAADAGLWYIALMAALAIPDICGAMESEDGRAHESKYIPWFDTYVGEQYLYRNEDGQVLHSDFDGSDCYKLRCSILHQGRGERGDTRYELVAFVPMGPVIVALPSIDYYGRPFSLAIIGIAPFVKAVVAGGRKWLAAKQDSPEFKANFDRFVQARPEGVPPWIRGWVICGLPTK